MMVKRILGAAAVAATLIGAASSGRDDAATRAQESQMQAAETWIVLDDYLALWARPGGEPGETRVQVEAGGEVQVDGRARGGDPETAWLHVTQGRRAGWLPEALLAPLPQAISRTDLARIGREPVDRAHGIPSDYMPADLTDVEHGYTRERTYKLRRAAAEALEKMIAAAAEGGVALKVVSAFRSYGQQRYNYLDKLKRSDWNQNTVAKPGHSEHQLGTTVDLTDGDLDHLLRVSFGETKAGAWLRERAPEFGFAVSYTAANQPRTGYAPEPWHYRFFGVEAAREVHAAALAGR